MRTLTYGWLLALVAGTVSAQSQFGQLRRLAFPDDDARSARASLLDLDGDGDLDLFSSGFYNPPLNRVYDNDGRGRFSPRPGVPGGGGLHVLGDVDLDGDLDIVMQFSWFENTATTQLLAHSTNVSGIPAAFGDLDGDLRGDIVCVGGSSNHPQVTIWRAVSPTSYVQLATPPLAVWTIGVELADFDNDGDLDVLIANNASGNIFSPPIIPGLEKVWRNDGGGLFTDVSSLWLPGAADDTTSDMVVADFDGDGNVDCAFLSGYSPQWHFRRNDGTGVLVPWSVPSVPGLSFDVHDLNADGAPDLVRTDRWLENLGAGVFVEHAVPGSLHELRCIGDVDNDGDTDIVLGGLASSGSGHRLLLDQGGQTFVDATQFAFVPLVSRDIIEADVDGDGDLDVLQENGPLFRNDGGGWFEPEPFPWSSGNWSYRGEFFVDTDSDGDLDVLHLNVGPFSSAMHVYLNDGAGIFTDLSAAVPPTVVPAGVGALSIDAEGDGAPDFVAREYLTGLSLFRNVGIGQFVRQPGAFPILSSDYDPVAAVDFDGDGDLDVLASNAFWNAAPALVMLVNDGTGVFTDDPARIVVAAFYPIRPRSVVVFDADQDGDHDVIVGNYGSASYPYNRHALMRNDGTGRLVEDPAALPNMSSGSRVAVGDIDGDGDQDISAMILTGLRDWRNDGFGNFSDHGAISLPVLAAPLRMADYDHDGDSDLLVYDRLWTNHAWHIEAPHLPRLGCSYSISFGGFASQSAVALPFFGSAVHIPVPPFGTIGVDPSTAIPLVPVPMTNGIGQLNTTIPSSPGLLGLQFSVQALLVTATGFHLTPTKRETIFN